MYRLTTKSTSTEIIGGRSVLRKTSMALQPLCCDTFKTQEIKDISFYTWLETQSSRGLQNTYTACPVAVWFLKPRIKTCGSVLNSPVLPEVNMVSKVKKNDVKKLLHYFEVTGEAKNLYTTVLADVSHQTFVIKL
ncbi:hypothetical protein ANN_02892 [Periplaneta americana]|uniref:Uncharacterized protein n=1 Tax=Periplaneta americana TaxID=6978 RepID=A0ABQ8U153_PERAM|nr:hypothetical protein ANN_02892 [Periplaneta americana]